ncbi:hypothetical protein ACFS07_01280 [Undibacterium arcticum]
MVIGARIVDAKTGGSPSFAQHVIRYLGYFVSTIPFCLGLIWVGIDKKKSRDGTTSWPARSWCGQSTKVRSRCGSANW